MKLLIHAGWSKTGTSAFQQMLARNNLALKNHGMLYPETAQWLDYAHHELALAITPHPILKNNTSLEILLHNLIREINASGCEEVIISSELFKNPFKNRIFSKFCESNFQEIECIFVVRRQSELLLSLYNQLIKDADLNYSHSIFGCFVDHIDFLNFNSVIKKWSSEITMLHNIKVFNYSSEIIENLYSYIFNDSNKISDNKIYLPPNRNESIPNDLLAAVRLINSQKMPIDKYKQTLEKILLEKNNQSFPKDIIFSAQEQMSIDAYYQNGNSEIADKLLDRNFLFENKNYEDIYAFNDSILKYIL